MGPVTSSQPNLPHRKELLWRKIGGGGIMNVTLNSHSKDRYIFNNKIKHECKKILQNEWQCKCLCNSLNQVLFLGFQDSCRRHPCDPMKRHTTLSSCGHLLHSCLHAAWYTFSVFKSEGQHKPNFYFLVKDTCFLSALKIFLRFV